MGIAIGDLHSQACGAKLADELSSPCVGDRLLDHVALEGTSGGRPRPGDNLRCHQVVRALYGGVLLSVIILLLLYAE
jgi:hypothetical protein